MGAKLGCGEETEVWVDSCSFFLIENYVPDPNTLPVKGWRSVVNVVLKPLKVVY